MKASGSRPFLAASLAIAALALGGCASMNESECRTVDWRTVGYEDGVAGYSGDRISQYRKACAKHGVSPSLALYQSGRTEGLREYCQPSNGFRTGASGGSYAGVCPADLDAAFVGAYESGRQLFHFESRVANARNEIESKRRELNHVEDQMVRRSALIVAGDTATEVRAQALVDTKQLAERAGRLKAEIRSLEHDLPRYEQELEDYRVTVAWIG